MKLDKKLHFGIAYVLTVALSYLVGYKKAVAIVESLIIGKEAHDKYLKQTSFSMPDVYAGNTGMLLGLITFSILKARGNRR